LLNIKSQLENLDNVPVIETTTVNHKNTTSKRKAEEQKVDNVPVKPIKNQRLQGPDPSIHENLGVDISQKINNHHFGEMATNSQQADGLSVVDNMNKTINNIQPKPTELPFEIGINNFIQHSQNSITNPQTTQEDDTNRPKQDPSKSFEAIMGYKTTNEEDLPLMKYLKHKNALDDEKVLTVDSMKTFLRTKRENSNYMDIKIGKSRYDVRKNLIQFILTHDKNVAIEVGILDQIQKELDELPQNPVKKQKRVSKYSIMGLESSWISTTTNNNLNTVPYTTTTTTTTMTTVTPVNATNPTIFYYNQDPPTWKTDAYFSPMFSKLMNLQANDVDYQVNATTK